mgnify:CR=1 FL=1
MSNPTLTIKGTKYVAPKPKAKAWYATMEMDSKVKEAKAIDLIDIFAEYLALVFEVSKDEIINNVDIGTIAKTTHEVESWIIDVVTGKVEELPKNQTSPALN